MSIQSTVDQGRVHLSLDGAYIDSVDSYNNFITRLFAWIVGWSICVRVGGKTRALDKTDYVTWLNRHTNRSDITVDQLSQFTDLALTQITQPANISPMRFHLSQAKTHSLYYKLVKSMYEKNDFESAKKYVAKGADLDRLFWTRGDTHGVSYGHMKERLPKERLQLSMRQFTPLLYAAERGERNLCDLMRRCNANSDIHGKRVEFNRDILSIIPASQLEPTYEIRWYPGSRYRHRPPHYRVHQHVNIHTTLIMKMRDAETKTHDLVFNPVDNSVVHQAIMNPQSELTFYDRIVHDSTYRLL